MSEKNYDSPAEIPFFEDGIGMILFRQGIFDERGLCREGDFRLDNGQLVEVKTDKRCFASSRPTYRIPIEIEHPKQGKGGFYWCIKEGVDYLFFGLYRDDNAQQPDRYILIPFEPLRIIVEAHLRDAVYKKRYLYSTPDGVKNLCMPLKEVLNIKGTRQLLPLSKEDADMFMTAIIEAIKERHTPARKEAEA